MNAENLDPPAAHTPDAGPAEKPYSPFWALLVVFLTLICLHVSYLADDLTQQAQIRSSQAQVRSAQAQLNAPTVNAPMTQAKAIGQTTQAIGQELLALSADSPAASNIVAEFNIRLNASPAPTSVR